MYWIEVAIGKARSKVGFDTGVLWEWYEETTDRVWIRVL